MALPYASSPRFDSPYLHSCKGTRSLSWTSASEILIRRNSKQASFSKSKNCLFVGITTGKTSLSASLADTTSVPPVPYEAVPHLLLADLDPATAKLAISITGPFLSAFGFLFIIRIVMSWYPKLPVGEFPYAIAYAPTEPFLSITRKVIPPLGGVDVTPVVWFGLVSFLNEILVGPQGLLVLLSQQK
ncbi:cofactor assembly, complex C (B6F) [Carex rostrata]